MVRNAGCQCRVSLIEGCWLLAVLLVLPSCGGGSSSAPALDTTPPLLIAPPNLIAVQPTGYRTQVDLGMPTVSDSSPVTITSSAPRDGFIVGERTLVVWSARDVYGNTSTDFQWVEIDPSPLYLPMHCAKWDGHGTAVGVAVLNNVWGIEASTTIGSQCVDIQNGSNGATVAHLDWDWPHQANVAAYPELIFGQKPGYLSTTPDLPRPLDTLQQASVAFDVQSSAQGRANLAFDLWLTSMPTPATYAAPEIMHEVMVWLDSYGMTPLSDFPAPIANVAIGGQIFDLYLGTFPFGVDAAGNLVGGWSVITYVSQTPIAGANTLDLLAFLNDARQRQLIVQPGLYLGSIEFGNEVVGGSGETLVYRFAPVVR